MKSALFSRRDLALLLLLALITLGGYGCATEEPDNASSKPWNSPEGWQNGNLPSNMTQPH